MPMPPDAWASDPSAQNEQPPDQYVKVGFVDSEPLPAKFLNWALGWIDSMFRVEHDPDTGAHTDVHADSLEVGGGYGGGSGATISGAGAGSFSGPLASSQGVSAAYNVEAGRDVISGGTGYGMYAGDEGYNYRAAEPVELSYSLVAVPYVSAGGAFVPHFDLAPNPDELYGRVSGSDPEAWWAFHAPTWNTYTAATITSVKLKKVNNTYDGTCTAILYVIDGETGQIRGQFSATLATGTSASVTLSGSAVDLTGSGGVTFALRVVLTNSVEPSPYFQAVGIRIDTTKRKIEQTTGYDAY